MTTACHPVCSNLQLVAAVAGSLHWPGRLQALAERVMAGMPEAGGVAYNSVHFRIEKDAKDWATIMGGVEVSERHRCIYL